MQRYSAPGKVIRIASIEKLEDENQQESTICEGRLMIIREQDLLRANELFASRVRRKNIMDMDTIKYFFDLDSPPIQ